jgi:hypothetical protein
MLIKILLNIFLNILIIGLFLFSKLIPYKDKLNSNYKGIYIFFDNIFSPIFNGLKSFIKPFQVGNGLSLDMTQIVLLIILLVLNSFF